MQTLVLNTISPEIEARYDALSKAIIKTFIYFDIFKYPLTIDEIVEYCQSYETDKLSVNNIVQELTKNNIIQYERDFYFINSNNDLIERKLQGSEKAKKYLKIAHRFSRLISHFPYVEGICISGSLAKGCMDKDGDIDYFIITKPGRLWLCRTMLIAFKKLFLLNSRKYFCVNYFIDTNSLEIPDKNLFTATELTFLLPTYNHELYVRLMEANQWQKGFYPNKKIRSSKEVRAKNKKAFLKYFFEWVFKNNLGVALDKFSFNMTIRYWKRKFKQFDESEFDLNLRSRKDVSKHHPSGFQIKVMKAYEDKIKEFENQFNMSLR